MSDQSRPWPGADRNLLFGVLALQMDFITRDALIAAMNAWVLDKTTPLGRLLLERGALSKQRHDLLENLVAEHLAQHGNDPVRSLSTVAGLPSLRNDSPATTDPEVRAWLSSLDAFCPPMPDRPPPAGVGQPTSAGRRFHVLRLHAQGGLGQVSVALDQELHREVALKEIQGAYADHPESRSRFLLEAEITGRLEHPGIVPVYGLGRHPDGRPFYAMRFIKGQSLEDRILQFHEADRQGRRADERALALRGLLRNFIDVCNAIAYAHSRGVLHRDLKPANVMLGLYGETLVVDWGLAKPLDERPDHAPRPAEGTLHPLFGSDADRTQAGAVLGTPAYMSPEQAAGRSDSIGPTSDVYSLGATLYCLLTGNAPFEGATVLDILEKVVRGAFLPPGRANRSVPAGLGAVCLKAMALRPEDRYPSPARLAEDIERWLADEAVRAYREPVWSRLGRWARHNRTWVAGAGALLVTAVVALSVGLFLLGRTQRETERQRARAEDNASRAGMARQEADTAAAIAKAQRELALRTVRAILDSGQLRPAEGESLDRTAMLREQQERMLQAALGRLQELAAVAATPDEAAQYVVPIQLARGDILLLARRYAEARRAYEDGRQLADRLVRSSPGHWEARWSLSLALRRIGDLNLEQGLPKSALEAHGNALTILEELARERADNREARWELCLALQRIGDLARERQDLGAAADAYRRGQSVAEEMARAGMDKRQALQAVRVCLLKQGDVRLKDDARAALALYRQALSASEKLAQYGGDHVCGDQAVCHACLGDAFLKMEDVPNSELAYRKALELAVQHERFNKGPRLARRQLASSYGNVGKVALLRDDIEGAVQALKNAQALFVELARTALDSVPAQLDLAEGHARLAEAQRRALEPDLALQHAESAVEVLRRLEAEGKLRERPRAKARLRELRAQAEECREAKRAVEEPKFALEQPAPRSLVLLGVRARVLAKRGGTVGAAEAAAELARLGASKASNLYEAACCFALCAAAVERGKREEHLTAQEKMRRDEYAGKAVEQLRKAGEMGWFRSAEQLARLRRERDLASVRRREDFQGLITKWTVE